MDDSLSTQKQSALEDFCGSLVIADFWVGRKAAGHKLLDMYRLMCVDEQVCFIEYMQFFSSLFGCLYLCFFLDFT